MKRAVNDASSPAGARPTLPLTCLYHRLAYLALLLLATGCALEGPPQTTVVLWHQMRPGDRAVLAERLRLFEKDNPGVTVREVYKETEELRSGLESAVLVGRGPDIVYGPADTVGVYAEIGALRDLRPWIDESERADFDPRALIYGSFAPPGDAPPDERAGPPAEDNGSGETKAEAQNADTRPLLLVGDRFGNHLALVYDRRLIPTPPRTTDELLALAKQNTVDENGDGRPERYGLVWNYTEPFFVVPFLTGYGAWVFDEQRAARGEFVPTLDTPEAREAYAFVASLRNEHGVLPLSADYNTASELFRSGKAAMLIDGDWSWAGHLAADEIEAAVAPLPDVSSTGLPMSPMVAAKGYSMSVAATGDREEAAGRVIRFLTSEATQRAFLERQKVLPSRLTIREEAARQSDPILAASLAQLERGRAMPTSLEIRAVWDAMRPPYQRIMGGDATPAEATAQMQASAIAKIATLKSDVRPDASVWVVRIGGVGLLAALVWGLAGWYRRLRQDFPTNRLAYALAAPAMLLIFVTVVFPLAYNVVLSFSNMSLQNFREWQVVGLQNYWNAFSGADAKNFWPVFLKTVFWTVINVSFHVAIGVFLAVMLHGPVIGKSLYRILLVIPWAVPAYITALTWRGMFDAEFGVVNQLVRSMNAWLPSWLDLPTINWLTEAGPAFAACIVANVWLGFPFMMVITLGGLQGIPQDMYEAARIDRATRWQQFWNITVPMLKPVLLPAIVLGSVWTFNNLNVVWLVSNGGEPADQTHILVSYVYKAVFNLYQYGYGAALSMIIFAMLLAFSAAFLRQTKAAEGV
ncbi:extracellular solute-binding protein [Botrimarina hoheduenensis]|uniref:Maltose transport system permease protein MalF n=1 Tax=Botrimarina hoheduenensis TaxID=2528000 RepID=A0A5C5WCG1_9BACT|nr:extracellular solute-binding protein [Botrimarina hoheduenensis]TWT48598.1 Maltose transport system permease protein MalF [Botrimarina hoheduenensis]